MRYPARIERAGRLVADLLEVGRRRGQRHRPRVRFRVGHGEANVLSEDSSTATSLVSIATALVAETRIEL